jgi:hypothetical protein
VLVKRIIVLLVVATLMLVMSALPALAINFGKEGGGPPLFSGYVGKSPLTGCAAQKKPGPSGAPALFRIWLSNPPSVSRLPHLV